MWVGGCSGGLGALSFSVSGLESGYDSASFSLLLLRLLLSLAAWFICRMLPSQILVSLLSVLEWCPRFLTLTDLLAICIVTRQVAIATPKCKDVRKTFFYATVLQVSPEFFEVCLCCLRFSFLGVAVLVSSPESCLLLRSLLTPWS